MDNPKESYTVVECLRTALVDGESSLGNIPALLKRTLKEGHWRRFVVRQTGEVVEYERFEKFVTTPPLEGLGATPDLIERIVRDDAEALTLLAEARTGKHGVHIGSSKKQDSNNVTITEPTDWKGYNQLERGNAAAYTLRRLKKQAPKLHQRVLDGKMSAHAAAIEAGWREKSITVPLNVDKAAAALRRHFDAKELKQLIALLKA